ncbi:MAG: hypothetical protein K6360_01965 [Deltaproteobacteria bacterium]
MDWKIEATPREESGFFSGISIGFFRGMEPIWGIDFFESIFLTGLMKYVTWIKAEWIFIKFPEVLEFYDAQTMLGKSSGHAVGGQGE